MKHKNTGFTLLEVLVAMAITGIGIGSLFGLLGGSKRLQINASDEIIQTLYLRSAINAAQIHELDDWLPDREGLSAKYDIAAKDLLPKPGRQTRKMKLVLEPYSILDEEGNEILTATRWKTIDIAR